MKRELAQQNYGQVERGSLISRWFIAFINNKLNTLIFMCKCIDVYVDFDGWYVYGIFVPIMMVIWIFYDSTYVCLSTWFYL